MGSVAALGHKVPLTVSGKGARIFTDVFIRHGMNIKYYGKEPGTASALKLLRSIFMKGLAMLLIESLDAGHKYGLEDDVWDSITATLKQSSEKRINSWITRTAVHSERREHELAEVVQLLQESGIDSTMSAAAGKKMNWVTSFGLREYFKGVPPEDFHKVLDAMKKAR